MSLTNSEAIFAVRIETCDHYTAPPIKNIDPEISSFRGGQPVRQTPIIRIFGCTPAGQKCCLHVHGAFPYFYVSSPVSTPSNEFLKQLAVAIDNSLNSSFDNTRSNGQNEKQKFERQQVYDITPISAIPLYGYHNEETLFLKISFYNPFLLKRAAELLQNGGIMNTVFQPFELHVPYELKFMIDHDLYGMDYIAVKNVKFRLSGKEEKVGPISLLSPIELSQRIWNVSKLEDRYRLPSDVKRVATCELEADCVVTDIVRLPGTDASGGQNPGVRFIWADEISRRKALRIDEMPTVAVSQDRPDLPMLPNETEQFELLRKILNAREGHNSQPVGSQNGEMAEEAAGDDSFRNLSLMSDQSMIHALAELMEDSEPTADTSGPSRRPDQLDGDIDEQSEEEHEEDAIREEIEMSQRIEEFSDGENENEETGRLAQVDGPVGGSDDSVTTIVISSDSSSEDEEKQNLGVVPESPQSDNADGVEMVDISAEDIPSPSPSRCEKASTSAEHAAQPATVSNEKLANVLSVLTPKTKLPSKKEMKQWLDESSKIGVEKSDTTLLNSQRMKDIDLMDLEEIERGLSPDESIVENGETELSQRREVSAGPIIATPVSRPRMSQSSQRSNSSVGRRRREGSSQIAYTSFGLNESDSMVESFHGEEPTNTPVSTKPKGFTLRRYHPSGIGMVKRHEALRTPKPKRVKQNVSELDAPSVGDSFGFNCSELNLIGAQVTRGAPFLAIMSLEVHVRTRQELRPDPEFDQIEAVFYAVHIDLKDDRDIVKGVILVCTNEDERKLNTHLQGFDKFQCEFVNSERALFDAVVNTVRKYDPDILMGYEIQLLSWGFLFERAQVLDVELCRMVSRVPDSTRHSWFSTCDDWWAMADVRIAGRIVLNLGRLLRHEVTLYLYSFENVVYHVLRKRVPSYDFQTLTQWYLQSKTRWRVLEHYFLWVVSELEILANCDVINRSSEMARLYGIQFYEVLSRGSQFRVESMLLRMAKMRNYVAFSPSVRQRNRMAAPECIALTMEPESRFYSDPVLLLDFQSLYPSVVIAYNYCFSTCLGRIRNYARGEVIEFGCFKLKIPFDFVESNLDDITISPAGVAFVKSHVRRGIMPIMLQEILDTRVMVKQSAKLYKSDKSLQKILDARQLGLKNIANVTYGYTAATYSGRMPCIEIADSIVQKGRETLIRAIEMVRNEAKWNARVVYGDTDSMFVWLPGRTKEEAFRIGKEICDAVAANNPKPIKLKLEKVYSPCVLQTKKRYVGYAYETPEQVEPIFDAKGIETVRRDACPATAKILRKALETLFVSKDLGTVRQYVVRQFQRIHQGRVSPLDFIFTRKYNGREHYRSDAAAPALQIAKRRLQRDRRAEPRIKERMAYLIVTGHPGATLVSLVREPAEFAFQQGLRVNYKYYITKQICPALNRVFSLMGVDTLQWYQTMPRVDRTLYGFGLRGERIANQANSVITISQYFQVKECIVCRTTTTRDIFCAECSSKPQTSAVELLHRIRYLERRRGRIYQMCNLCTMWPSSIGTVECTSIICPITYKRTELDQDLERAQQLRRVLDCL